MRKFIVAILAILYFATSTGATIHLHYCMGDLERMSFTGSKGQECPYCGMLKAKASTKGCCKDEQKQIKLSQDQITTSFANEVINVAPAAAPQSLIEIPVPFLMTITERHPFSNSPPDSNTVPFTFKTATSEFNIVSLLTPGNLITRLVVFTYTSTNLLIFKIYSHEIN